MQTHTPLNRPPIILTHNRPKDLQSHTERLADFFGLLPWGTTYLTETARRPLRQAAILLGMIFLFDLAAWTILFSLIFNSGVFAFNFLMVPAFLFAFGLSTAAVFFEINIFTTDFDGLTINTISGKKTWAGILARIAIVIGSAFMTAQPLHVMFFNAPIAQRAQKEQAIHHAAVIAKDALDKLQNAEDSKEKAAKVRSTTTDCSSVDCKAYSARLKDEEEKLAEINDAIREGKIAVASAKRQRESLVRMKEELNKELGKHRADQRTLERRLKNEFLNASEKARLEKQLSYAVSLQRDKQRQIKQRDGEISEIDEGLLPKESEVQTLEGEVDQHNQTTTDLLEKLRVAAKTYEGEQVKINGETSTIIIEEGNKEKAKEVYYRSFLLEILNSRLSWGEEVKAKSLGDVNLGAEAKLLTFTLDPVNFFERLRIWDDLRFAHPAKWPEALSEKESKYILDNFKLSAEVNEEYKKALRREAKNYWWDNLMTTALGMLLPLLVLIFKLTLPEGLKRYYSKRYQAFCGHPDAVRELSFEKVKS